MDKAVYVKFVPYIDYSEMQPVPTVHVDDLA